MSSESHLPIMEQPTDYSQQPEPKDVTLSSKLSTLSRHLMRLLTGPAGGLLLMFLGQWRLMVGDLLTGLPILLLGLAVAVGLGQGRGLHALSLPWVGQSQRRWAAVFPVIRFRGLLLIALALGLQLPVLYLDYLDKLPPGISAKFYGLSILLVFVGILLLEPVHLSLRSLLLPSSWRELAVLALVLALAGGVRLYRVDTLPPGLWGDETLDGLDANRMLDGQLQTPFRNDELGNGNLKALINATSVYLFGATPLALRVVAVGAAVLSLLGTFLLARLWFGPLTGFLTLLFMSFSRWHLHRSRFDSTVMLALPLVVFGIYFTVRGFQGVMASRTSPVVTGEARGSWRLLGLGGLCLGLSLNFYHGYRLIPVVVGLYLIIEFLRNRMALPAEYTQFSTLPGPQLRQMVLGMAVVGLGFFVTFAPYGQFAILKTGSFLSRLSYVSVWNNRVQFQTVHPGVSIAPGLGTDLQILGWQIADTVLMFNYQGDGNGLVNYHRLPQLDPLTAIFFLLGVGLGIWHWRDNRFLMLWLWLVQALIFGSILTIGAPSSTRVFSAVPAVMILAGAGAAHLWRWLQLGSWSGIHRLPVGGILSAKVTQLLSSTLGVPLLAGLVLGVAGASNLSTYFREYLPSTDLFYDFGGRTSALGPYMRQVMKLSILSQDPGTRFVFLNEGELSSHLPTIRFQAPGFQGIDITQPSDLVNPMLAGSGDTVYVAIHPQELAPVQLYFPGGRERQFYDPLSRTILASYELPAAVRRSQVGLAPVEGAPGLTIGEQGSLYIPTFGIYHIWLEGQPGNENSLLLLDGKPVKPGLVHLNQTATASSKMLLARFGRSAVPAWVELAETAPTNAGITRFLPAGWHTVAISLQNSETSLPAARLRWYAPWKALWLSENSQTVPGMLLSPVSHAYGLTGQYFNNPNFEGPPGYMQRDPIIYFHWLDGQHAPFSDAFSVKWQGYLDVPQDGTYSLGIYSAQPAWLFLDGKQVVDGHDMQGEQERTVSLKLAAGAHALELRYAWQENFREVELFWIPPGQERSTIPPEALSP
ncbi:MAG: hypothetical protein EXR62_01265 [Chloroflexi bacterium]|nr:hypothetical protein [Chloroflexota bacterium]